MKCLILQECYDWKEESQTFVLLGRVQRDESEEDVKWQAVAL